MAVPTRKILVSGSSGLIGSNLVRALRGERIHAISLVRKKNSEWDSQGSEQVLWDTGAAKPVGDPDLEQLEGAEAAVHLSGANLSSHRWTESYKREIVSSRIGSTEALVRVFRGLKEPPKALLCASAIGVYGNRGDEMLTEDARSGEGFLAEVCVAWERAADEAKALGIRVVHLRFGVVLSPEGGALKQMLPIFKLGVGGKLGSGRQWMSWIALADLIAAIQFLISADGVAGAVNMTAPQPVTNAEFTRVLGQTLHRPTVVPAPAFALRMAFGQMADDALLASTRAIPRRLSEAGFQFAYPELRAALRALL